MPLLFTTVSDGNLALHVGDDPVRVASHRAVLAAKLGVQASQLRWMNQVHGNRVVIVGDEVSEADGIVTTQSGIALGVLVADCVPLLLADEVAGVIAAVHVGRRGLVNQVALRAVDMMKTHGAVDIEALLGPAIRGACYEVPREMQQEVVRVAPASLSRSSQGTPALDIRAGLAEQLAAVDVAVSIDSRCTRESEEFFSYRRDPSCGRFAGVIMVA